MPFQLPDFGLSVNLWRWATGIGNPPDLTFMANLSLTKARSVLFTVSVAGRLNAFMRTELLCPKGTNIIGAVTAASMDRVEVPAGSGRFYGVLAVDDVAKGYSNEYRLASLIQLTSEGITLTNPAWGPLLWPVPTP